MFTMDCATTNQVGVANVDLSGMRPGDYPLYVSYSPGSSHYDDVLDSNGDEYDIQVTGAGPSTAVTVYWKGSNYFTHGDGQKPVSDTRAQKPGCPVGRQTVQRFGAVGAEALLLGWMSDCESEPAIGITVYMSPTSEVCLGSPPMRCAATDLNGVADFYPGGVGPLNWGGIGPGYYPLYVASNRVLSSTGQPYMVHIRRGGTPLLIAVQQEGSRYIVTEG
jgi:hypothetical protein